MKCTYCRDPLGENCVPGGYCSVSCRVMAEHEEKLREREVLTIQMSEMDDGGCSVQIALRLGEGLREMARTYDGPLEAFRGIADICSKTADDMEAARE